MKTAGWRPDQTGAVFVEKLIVYLPLLTAFFAAWELAEFGAASLVVQRASGAAGRAAMVVLGDDPSFYGDEPVGSYDGLRREDIELAAGMVLSAVPRLNEAFEVDVTEPKDLGDEFEVTLTAQYDCGLVSLICGGDAAIDLEATSKHTYHGAKYPYTFLAGTFRSGSDSEDASFRAPGGGGGGGGGGAGPTDTCKLVKNGKCMSADTNKLIRKVLEKDYKPKSCGTIDAEIRQKTQLVKDRIKCVSKAEAKRLMAEDLEMRSRAKGGTNGCQCTPAPKPEFDNLADNQLRGNACRAFTTYKDEVITIRDDRGNCPDENDSDVLHETIHVMSAHGGTNYFEKEAHAFNEAMTQLFTESAATGPVTPAYNTGAEGEWKRCLASFFQQNKQVFCEAFFMGDEDAWARALIPRVRSNLRHWEAGWSDDKIIKELKGFKYGQFWKDRVCPQGTGGGGGGGGPSFPPPPPPPGPGGVPPPPPPPPGPGGIPPPPPPPP